MTTTITAQTILGQLKVALRKFGEHSFFDKGPYEVMDFDGIVKSLGAMEPEAAIAILQEVLKEGSAPATHLAAVLTTELLEAAWPDEVYDLVMKTDARLAANY